MTKYRTVYRTILLSALVICSGIANQAAAAPPAYTVTDLGTLGGKGSAGFGINASGQVTGTSGTTGDAASHAFLWTPTTPGGVSGTLHDLGTLGGTYSQGYGINASGQVTGYAYTTTGSAAEHAFLYDGTMHDLGTLGGTYSNGLGVNASGQVSGWSNTTGDATQHALLWTPTTPHGASGTMYDLGTLGGTTSEGSGINDSGQVTGQSSTIGDAESHAILWTPTTPGGASGMMHDLGTLGGTHSEGNAINASGQVAGWSYTTGASAHAFLYDGTLHDLGTLGGTNSYGYGINASGQVTGWSYTTGNAAAHAFLYTSGPMLDLNSLIAPLSGWQLSVATAINDAGQIAGYGSIGGEQHAFLLNPVPEPTSLALFALGLPLLVWRHSRRLSTGGVRGVRRFARAAH